MSESRPSRRKFGREKVNCDAILHFASRNAHPRVKGHMFQIGKGGCAVTTTEKLYIGEECIVWATGGGHKYIGASGKIVWIKPLYEGQPTMVVGIEFKHPIELSPDLLDAIRGLPT